MIALAVDVSAHPREVEPEVVAGGPLQLRGDSAEETVVARLPSGGI
jgi:hypothetical protein